ncbi:MAG: hypothetical protein R3321_00660 [Nitrososphaeraceae archaeon]|nr:hypothetical protein [Nitrososphaeraceae archaeon]
MLPLTFTLPVARILRCPRLLEIASEQFNVDLQTITDAFYDMVELSFINPTEFPAFNWFIVAEDEEDPEMIWFLSETNIQLAIKLDEDPNNIRPLSDRTPSNTTLSDMDTIAALTTSINNAIRERFGDDSLVPILKEIPTKNNNYLFRDSGVLVGEFKFEEDQPYQPFIMEQLDSDNYALYLTDKEFLYSYCERVIREDFGSEYDKYELILHEDLEKEINSQGQISSFFKFKHWDNWEEFTILHDPDNYKDYDCVIPVLAISRFAKSHISEELKVNPEDIKLCELPLTINDYYSINGSDTMYVEFRYNNELKSAQIWPVGEDEEMYIKVLILDNENSNSI